MRAKWKGPNIDWKLYEQIQASVIETKQIRNIRTMSRSSSIIPEFVNLRIDVYNGRYFIPVHVTSSMIGHKLGEFVHTCRRVVHKVKVKKKNKR